jgi:hypothetical protein
MKPCLIKPRKVHLRWSLIPLFFLPCLSYSQTPSHFYSYGDAVFERNWTKMALLGREDPWIQKIIKNDWIDLTKSKQIIHRAENGLLDPIPPPVAARILFPKPDEKLWTFVDSPKLGKTVFLGTTHAESYLIGEGSEGYEVSFKIDPKPLKNKSLSVPEFSNYEDWGDWESWEMVFISVPKGTKRSLLPKATHLSTATVQPLLDKIDQRFKDSGVKDADVKVEMALQALGQKYLVVQVTQPWNFTREIYQLSKKGFILVYRNSMNTAETD